MIDDNPLIFAPHSISADTFRRVLRSARSPAFVETEALLAALDDWGADRGIALAFYAKESSYGLRGVAVRTAQLGQPPARQADDCANATSVRRSTRAGRTVSTTGASC
jgi:hypothetical protein